ncbi:Peptidase family M28 [Amycolatopsis tolypomycina]|uniref:Peptidase family M28 n=1 Tax=Amycolatopsis tolypomycina TaxID=208445 RepID=A0A1H4JN04_9PSEU|nr:M28 family peptidase [Amycolatopsis tolypomycina]SEB47012.1 Peptidase family M28 [Amycolatopsis tolypomycina]
MPRTRTSNRELFSLFRTAATVDFCESCAQVCTGQCCADALLDRARTQALQLHSRSAAADNASGIAVALEAARIRTPTMPDGAGLAVGFLDAEEIGARGSAHHAPTVAPDTVVINVDGAQLGDAPTEAGGPAHALLAALDQAGRETGVPPRAGAMASGNRRYAAAGLPAAGIGMGIPGYQTPAETADRVETHTLVAATRLVVATVRQLAGSVTG